MKHIYPQFIANLNSLNHYDIIKYHNDYLIMGSTVEVSYREEIHGIFSLNMRNVKKNFPVFFILALSEEFADFQKFQNRNYKMLILSEAYVYQDIDVIEDELENFMRIKFRQ